MAKKKQLAGKKTKLAKLPLTQALAQKAEEAAPWGPLPAAGEASRQPFLPAENLAEDLRQVWARTYFQVVQDLAVLHMDLSEPSPTLAAIFPQVRLPQPLPQPRAFKQALRLARKGLRDLYLLLSGS
jgi:hypothetical protein